MQESAGGEWDVASEWYIPVTKLVIQYCMYVSMVKGFQ